MSTEIVQLAAALAAHAHADQTDKAGAPYVLHAQAVATRAGHLAAYYGWDIEDRELAQAAGWLHATLEDTWVTRDLLEDLRFPNRVIDAVLRVSRGRVTTEGYYGRIKGHDLARLVKQADLAHNTEPHRMARLDTPTRERLTLKYLNAYQALNLTPPAHLLEATA